MDIGLRIDCVLRRVRQTAADLVALGVGTTSMIPIGAGLGVGRGDRMNLDLGQRLGLGLSSGARVGWHTRRLKNLRGKVQPLQLPHCSAGELAMVQGKETRLYAKLTATEMPRSGAERTGHLV